MLTEIVTRALSQLTGNALNGDGIKGNFSTPMPVMTANSWPY